MIQFLKLYGLTAVLMWPLDVLWLSTMGRRFYRSELGDLLLATPRLLPAIAFYVVYVAGIVVFAVMPALRAGSWTTALSLGALLGFVSYATYDLTNLSTLRGFSVAVGLVDLAWGTALTASVALGAYALSGFLGLTPR